MITRVALIFLVLMGLGCQKPDFVFDNPVDPDANNYIGKKNALRMTTMDSSRLVCFTHGDSLRVSASLLSGETNSYEWTVTPMNSSLNSNVNIHYKAFTLGPFCDLTEHFNNRMGPYHQAYMYLDEFRSASSYPNDINVLARVVDSLFPNNTNEFPGPVCKIFCRVPGINDEDALVDSVYVVTRDLVPIIDSISTPGLLLGSRFRLKTSLDATVPLDQDEWWFWSASANPPQVTFIRSYQAHGTSGNLDIHSGSKITFTVHAFDDQNTPLLYRWIGGCDYTDCVDVDTSRTGRHTFHFDTDSNNITRKPLVRIIDSRGNMMDSTELLENPGQCIIYREKTIYTSFSDTGCIPNNMYIPLSVSTNIFALPGTPSTTIYFKPGCTGFIDITDTRDIDSARMTITGFKLGHAGWTSAQCVDTLPVSLSIADSATPYMLVRKVPLTDTSIQSDTLNISMIITENAGDTCIITDIAVLNYDYHLTPTSFFSNCTLATYTNGSLPINETDFGSNTSRPVAYIDSLQWDFGNNGTIDTTTLHYDSIPCFFTRDTLLRIRVTAFVTLPFSNEAFWDSGTVFVIDSIRVVNPVLAVTGSAPENISLSIAGTMLDDTMWIIDQEEDGKIAVKGFVDNGGATADLVLRMKDTANTVGALGLAQMRANRKFISGFKNTTVYRFKLPEFVADTAFNRTGTIVNVPNIDQVIRNNRGDIVISCMGTLFFFDSTGRGTDTITDMSSSTTIGYAANNNFQLFYAPSPNQVIAELFNTQGTMAATDTFANQPFASEISIDRILLHPDGDLISIRNNFFTKQRPDGRLTGMGTITGSGYPWFPTGNFCGISTDGTLYGIHNSTLQKIKIGGP
ncbi:MAG: hypothetical protein A2268_06950 [Candidatus Raymondbacteria bacterium RifOxyA12_full_50_37]|uniref:Uncharacterized protein n=1 Tax=Candidatus Raymondbacteria bacterium RIFOXYD12_FULL_49_13 TaxID=1817890 RepID=A0A1F7FER5_UNCRA|nr:MAG: hypothetical protein A2268_06950 [Candidatus Raymondbacteria bacterium RifOxyA12_full_50_37]OGJ91125.1 MAG: hypothetical protein A2248_01105 [Candidatus Raymondbacteria bacterium RIFOXYA2_FULL_49_16]OGJ97522.1 MAG: hypothetical protein A2453_01865 [Candidatus Raymondbacteria bacterium RIFOXYC2_FULL_50_21]OGK00174.1 MAG: hypothetical protein A2350_16435 [Candidatus Raymondbacteria bacterium RifOxyB12_full_50_8]OGK04997.1 MAG: hypothetical protein A2519_09975 [Candidatus Raymondbacteria b